MTPTPIPLYQLPDDALSTITGNAGQVMLDLKSVWLLVAGIALALFGITFFISTLSKGRGITWEPDGEEEDL